ncbi:MAG: radical SAM protein [Deltaproteobacteria bacterium]|nr:radical SAM protein [Deltaproteobacteria bacterium]
MRCNYTCRHCFYECGPDMPGDYMENDVVSAVRQQVLRLQRLGIMPTLNLIGGEPTLKMERFGDILREVMRWDVSVSVVTNGWWLGDELAAREFFRVVGPYVDCDGHGVSGGFSVRISNDKWHDEQRTTYLRAKGIKTALAHVWEMPVEIFYDIVPVCSGCGEELDSTDEPTQCCDSYVEYSEMEVVSIPTPPHPGDPWIYVDVTKSEWGTSLERHVVPIGRGYNVARDLDMGCSKFSSAGDLSYTPDGKLMDICCKGSWCEFGSVHEDPLLLLALSRAFTEELKPYCYECRYMAKSWALENLEAHRVQIQREIEELEL